MNVIKMLAAVTVLAMVTSSWASETVTYKYDARGRLKIVEVARGGGNNTSVSYTFDAASNRTEFVVSGSSSNGTITINPVGLIANQTSYGVSIGVVVSGSGTPTGMVTFSENGVYLGSMFVSGGQASIILEGFPLGSHRITANYSGDATHPASTMEFTVRIQDLSWLPGVLELLLAD